MAPFTFQGGCNTDIFNAWFEKILLPAIPIGTTLIIDNPAFHKSEKTKEPIKNLGCHLLFLPTYSPYLNLIEHCWHKIKSILMPIVQKGYDNLQDLIGECLLTI